MKNIISTVIFILMEIFLAGYLIMLFIVPLMTINIKFDKIYDIATKEKVDNIIYAIREKNIIRLKNDVVENIENIEISLTQLDDFFAQNNLINEQLINCSFETFTSVIGNMQSSKVTKFVYSVELEKGYGALYIDILETDGVMKIRTLRINQLEQSMSENHKFYRMPMDTTRIFFFIVLVTLIFFVMYSELDYYRLTKNRKIWLQIVMPVSAVAFSVNWNTLALNISFFAINITPVSLSSSGIMGEWRLTFYLPVITILYWIIFRKKFKEKENDNMENELGIKK